VNNQRIKPWQPNALMTGSSEDLEIKISQQLKLATKELVVKATGPLLLKQKDKNSSMNTTTLLNQSEKPIKVTTSISWATLKTPGQHIRKD
jgi:hypothetical protein